MYEFNLNQMSDEMRDELAGAYKAGSSNQLLVDPIVKMAMACSIDKNAFVEENLLGLGSYADSLVPPQNTGHYWYPTLTRTTRPGRGGCSTRRAGCTGSTAS